MEAGSSIDYSPQLVMIPYQKGRGRAEGVGRMNEFCQCLTKLYRGTLGR